MIQQDVLGIFLSSLLTISGIGLYCLAGELDKSDEYGARMAKSYGACESKRRELVFKEYACRKGYPKDVELEDVLKEGNL